MTNAVPMLFSDACGKRFILPYVAADFGHLSCSRNPLIFSIFTRMHLVESVGTGIPRIARILSEDGFPLAEYKKEGFFTTVLRKKPSVSTHPSDHSGQKCGQKDGQNNRERIVALMEENGVITSKNLAETLGINRSAVSRHIDKLKKDGRHAIARKSREIFCNLLCPHNRN